MKSTLGAGITVKAPLGALLRAECLLAERRTAADDMTFLATWRGIEDRGRKPGRDERVAESRFSPREKPMYKRDGAPGKGLRSRVIIR
jgi:hypothetical protein